MAPHQLKTFVQNIVVQINELTNNTIWRHVMSKDNPADLLSRGVYFDQLKEDNIRLWWYGPSFLYEPTDSWLINNNLEADTPLPEVKSKTINLLSTDSKLNVVIDFDRLSCFNRLQRTGAYVLRFIHNARASCSRRPRKTGSLTAGEISDSLQMLVRLVQQQSFYDEYRNLIRGLPVKERRGKRFNKIAGLNIFLDTNNIIRVGGRLHHSQFNYERAPHCVMP